MITVLFRSNINKCFPFLISAIIPFFLCQRQLSLLSMSKEMNTVELGYNVTKGADYFVSLYMNVVITE
jgi:hypothetical protein